MNILIYRFYKTDRCVDSEVFLDGEPFCQASESTKGLVPEGEYRVCLQHCRQYQREVPAVEIRPMGARKWLDRCRYCMRRGKAVMSPHRNLRGYCPQLKDGNGVYNRTDGSILLGERVVPGVVKCTSKYFTRLVELLQQAAQNGEEVKVIIKTQKTRQLWKK